MNLTNMARIGVAVWVGAVAANAQVSTFIAPYSGVLSPVVSLGTPPNTSQASGNFGATLTPTGLSVTVNANATGAWASATPTVAPSAPAELRMGSTLAGSTWVANIPGTTSQSASSAFGVVITEAKFTSTGATTVPVGVGKYWVVVNGLYGGVSPAINTQILAGDFTVVPEPETYAAAAALGLVGFGLWRRRSA